MEPKEYYPISCVFYDFIEHYAIRKEMVTIVYKDEMDETQEINGIITATMTKDSQEFIHVSVLKEPIRMDYLISVGGNLLSDYQKC